MEAGSVDTYHTFIFVKHLIIFAQWNKEDKSRDILKAVYPLLAFTSLATHIEQPVCELSDSEHRLSNTRRLNSRPKDILISWHIIRVSHPINLLKVTVRKNKDQYLAWTHLLENEVRTRLQNHSIEILDCVWWPPAHRRLATIPE